MQVEKGNPALQMIHIINTLKTDIMKERKFILSRPEAELALTIVNYVVLNSTIDAKTDADGIYLEVQDFIKFLSAEDTITLMRLLQRLRLFEDLDGKIIDAITED